ncbi:MAG: class I SAM-dependent methyltransferase [Pyrinomonadaceae bacterium]
MREPAHHSRQNWFEQKRYERATRALERQLDYQREKEASSKTTEDEMARFQFLRSQMIRKRLENVKPISATDLVLEVGSGVSGLVFGFGNSLSVGIDPLAHHYKQLYPKLQATAHTVAAFGEELPFADASFDIVLSDNVIDHGARPFAIIDEMMRVLRPGGLLFFTVNIHHPIYHFASMAHGAWNSLGLKLELSAFADHTVHLTERRVVDYFAHQPLKIIEQSSSIARGRASGVSATSQESNLKKVFFKNGIFELLAERLA